MAQRVRYELLRYHGNCCFLTLTANPATIHKTFPDGSLDHRPFQLFMKRLRITLERQGFKGKIKYLMCGEYGDNNGRPHYHAIIFGWKPEDLRYKGTSRKGLKRYKSKFLDSIWKDTSATQKEIDDFNNNPANSNIIKDNGGKYDFLPLGFVEVGEVNENTSPYMAKYICKFSEVKREDFEINGKKVKKPGQPNTSSALRRAFPPTSSSTSSPSTRLRPPSPASPRPSRRRWRRVVSRSTSRRASSPSRSSSRTAPSRSASSPRTSPRTSTTRSRS